MERVLAFAGYLALAALAAIYTQSGAVHRDLWENPNWTISRVMIYEYNLGITYFALFPAFLTICVFYSVKLHKLRIWCGSTVAIAGGVGLIANPVTTHAVPHVLFALVIFAASGFWFPECSARQFRRFAVSSACFFGGFLLDVAANGGGGVVGTRGLLGSGWLYGGMAFMPSVMCAGGELGIFVTWGQMVQRRPGHADDVDHGREKLKKKNS